MLRISPTLLNKEPYSLANYQVGGALKCLSTSDETEVLEFLQTRPLHAAYLSGMIQDNGLVNPLNRGTFYGYRNELNVLEGVALIGHAILLETMSQPALKAFAECARNSSNSHVIMCDEERMPTFWSHYAMGGQDMRRACRELLLELRWPVEHPDPAYTLRLATKEDLESLIPIHAEMARSESGIDPLCTDPTGFVSRYARRIEAKRTWVLKENEELVFKAEVVAQTAHTTYVEGVWVNPKMRGHGHGRKCMSALAHMLFWQSKSICLFVNDDDETARAFYRRCGYHHRGTYDTIYLQ